MRPFTRAALFPVIFAASSVMAAEKSSGLPKNSPFMPVAANAAPTETANERIEFAGVSTIGKKTDLIFYDKTARKSHWIGLGETKEGIAVMNYDEQREQAVVKVNGVEKVLSLRKGARPGAGPRPVTALPAAAGFAIAPPLPAGVSTEKILAAGVDPTLAAPAPVSQPVAAQQPAPPTTPEAQAQVKAETEARMLVSDLLEIGMVQRKAYEEAQRKAAEGVPQNAAPQNPAPANPVQTPQP
jgi:hypothetical protein